MVHQIAEVRLVIGLKVPRLYDLIASRIRNIQRRGVFILPMVPPAAWLSSYKHNKKTDTKIEKLEKIIKDIGFGEIRVIIQDGKPIRIEEIKKSVKL